MKKKMKLYINKLTVLQWKVQINICVWQNEKRENE